MTEKTMDDFEFFESEDGMGPAKATVHRSGKLGFSRAANKLIDFEANKAFKVGRRKAEESSDVLFMIPVPVEEENEFTFKVIKAGGYYSIKVKRLLNQLGIDYRNEEESLIYDIDEMKDGGKKYFKLTRRKRKTKSSSTVPDTVA